MKRPYLELLFLLVFAVLFPSCATPIQAQALESSETHYLAFQVFTGSPNPEIPIGGSGTRPLGPIPSEADLGTFVHGIVQTIGTVGDHKTHLAVIFGPLAFDNSDADIKRLVAEAFDIALQQNVAVGFHIDDSMFWAGRRDLWSNPQNVEWMDWNGTPSTGRSLEWGPKPTKVAPQMCYNSPQIEAEVRRRSQLVIGAAIDQGLERLKREGKQDLFAGVIVGWETQLGQDYDTGRFTGYHALANLGYTAKNPPRDMDAECEQVVGDYVTLWCKGLADAGIPPTKLYSHIAVYPTKTFDEQPRHPFSYVQQNHYATPDIAFGPYRRPGFSTYPSPGIYEQIHTEVSEHGNPGWASSEGTNLMLGGPAGDSGMNMESYLAQMFNHGATLVNVFAWGIGGDANKKMSFRVVTEGGDSIVAYRKFLSGRPLVESSTAFDPADLQAKLHLIQRQLPTWVQKPGNPQLAQPLINELTSDLKSHDFTAAETVANSILKLVSSQ